MYKFIKTVDPENKFDKTNVIIELPHNEQSIDDLLEAFEEFMRGCGFVFDGHLEVVDEEE
jgi:hypothetical protein